MIDDLLRGLLSEAIGEREKTKQPVGIVSEELRKEYREWKEEKEELEAEVKFRIERLETKMKKMIVEEFETKFETTENKKDELWKKIRGELGLIDESELNINVKTGLVSQWVKKDRGPRH